MDGTDVGTIVQMPSAEERRLQVRVSPDDERILSELEARLMRNRSDIFRMALTHLAGCLDRDEPVYVLRRPSATPEPPAAEPAKSRRS